ncbi:MAG: carbohydrate ABC transporter permease [Caldicoprobacterales bacterium]|jgi:putative aldouronate transport system permease protein
MGMVTKSSTSRKIFNVFNYGFFLMFTFICVYPLWYVLSYAISNPQLAAQEGVTFLPIGFTLSNFQQVFTLDGLFNSLLISILRTVIGTSGTVLCCMWLGYVFTKDRMPGRTILYRFLIITMYISGGMIPTFLVYRAYGLLDNFWVYILPYLVSPYYVILIKTFIEQLPASMEESAMLDGAGSLTIYFRIILPLSMPIVATIAVFAGVGQWNQWFDNHIYTFNTKSLTTMQYMLYNYLSEAQRLADELAAARGLDAIARMQQSLTPRTVRMTVTMITVLPVLAIYPFFQRYIVKGIMVGAIKG